MLERRSPRIDVRGRARVEVDGFKGHITLLNISPGSFGIATTGLLSAGTPVAFRFSSLDDRWSLTLAARLAYIRIDPGAPADRDLYLAGLSFVDAHVPAVARQIEQLVERVTGLAQLDA